MKNLTVQQKNYLTKRIDSIAQKKLNAIEDEYKGRIVFRTGANTGLDLEAAQGVIDGKIKVYSAKELLERIADQIKQCKMAHEAAEEARQAGRYYGHQQRSVSLVTFDFVNREDVKKFHAGNNKAAHKINEEKKKRREKVTAEATKVKDKVILEGSAAAVTLLEEFANKKF